MRVRGDMLLDTPILREMVYRYLVATIECRGWEKGCVHEEIGKYLAKILEADWDLNQVIILDGMRELLTDHLVSEIALPYGRGAVTKTQVKMAVGRFIKKLDSILPFFKMHQAKTLDDELYFFNNGKARLHDAIVKWREANIA